jgi:catechol 2,3-dioxygenase-like lactoylglutathione lyase family enzyme
VGAHADVGVDHVGVTVTDLAAAIDWYGAVFRLRLVKGPELLGDDEERIRDIFGPELRRFRIAQVGPAGGGTRLQLFEFDDPPVERRPDGFEYLKTGFSHISIACPDVAAGVTRLEAHGGRRRSAVYGTPPGPVYCYCEDPDGNVIELIEPESFLPVDGADEPG